jgi:hypothetical protein
MTLTKHAQQRQHERGLPDHLIRMAITRGTPEVSRGAVRVRWRDVVVVCVPEPWGLEIITAYRSN